MGNSGVPPTRVLSVLTKSRLLELAGEFAVAMPPSVSKGVQIDRLVRAGEPSMAAFVRFLTRAEFKQFAPPQRPGRLWSRSRRIPRPVARPGCVSRRHSTAQRHAGPLQRETSPRETLFGSTTTSGRSWISSKPAPLPRPRVCRSCAPRTIGSHAPRAGFCRTRARPRGCRRCRADPASGCGAVRRRTRKAGRSGIGRSRSLPDSAGPFSLERECLK
jgi:hypothetical protein